MISPSNLQILSDNFKRILNSSGSLVHTSDLGEYDWSNWLWTSTKYRRAHLQIIDKLETHKLYVLHCTVFPHFRNSAPIFGFDTVCGPNKVSGAFYDFSPVGDYNHSLIQWFANGPASLSWNKVRGLPDWAKAIFSPYMITASNIQTQEEIDQLTSAAILGLETYLDKIDDTAESGNNFYLMQNRYCQYQKKNPQVVRSMVNVGVPEEKIKRFIDEVLFPEVM